MESGSGVVDGVGGHKECLRDGICLESQDRDILLELELELESGKVVEKGVPLQLQDGDILLELELELESGKVVRKGVPLQCCCVGFMIKGRTEGEFQMEEFRRASMGRRRSPDQVVVWSELGDVWDQPSREIL